MADAFSDTNSMLDFVAKKGNGIKGLVELGMKEVPPLYIQPLHKRFDEKIDVSSSPSADDETYLSSATVPIDLSKLDGPDHDKAAKAISRAAETLGFFQVINHGLELEHLDALKDAANRFFAKPAEAKAALLRGVSPTPLVRYTTSFVPDKEQVLEWRDHVSMIYTNDEDGEKHFPVECKKEVLDYISLSRKMVTQIFQVLVENLGVDVENSRMENLIALRVVNLNYYPPCPSPDLTIGIGRHSDIGTFTVLLQDDIGDLYVKVPEDILAGKKEEWISIPPIPGALVINIGDSLQILSNGKYKSSEHKAYTTSKKSRVSIPLFVAPEPSETVSPFPELVVRDGGARYKDVVYEDYVANYMASAHDIGKIGIDFVKI